MNYSDKFGYYYVRFLVNPKLRQPSLNFKNSLTSALSVLVVPCANPDQMQKSDISGKISSLFPDKNISVFTPDASLLLHSDSNQYRFTSRIKDVLHSQSIKNISGSRFDVIIDLDVNFNLAAAYLSRLLNPKVRICFNKPYTKPFYNFVFNTSQQSSYENKVIELCKFLKGVIA